MSKTPPIFKTFPPSMQKLLDMIAENLYFISEQEMTREQALAIKERLSRPLGNLGAKHHIQPERKTFRQKSVDSTRTSTLQKEVTEAKEPDTLL